MTYPCVRMMKRSFDCGDLEAFIGFFPWYFILIRSAFWIKIKNKKTLSIWLKLGTILRKERISGVKLINYEYFKWEKIVYFITEFSDKLFRLLDNEIITFRHLHPLLQLFFPSICPILIAFPFLQYNLWYVILEALVPHHPWWLIVDTT